MHRVSVQFLLRLLSGSRDESTDVDDDKAVGDADRIIQSASEDVEDDELKPKVVVMEILSTVNCAQARATSAAFEESNGQSLEAFLEGCEELGADYVKLCRLMLEDRISGFARLLSVAVENENAEVVMRILGQDPKTVNAVWKLYDQRQASKDPSGGKLLPTLQDTFADWFTSCFKWTGLTDGDSDFFKVLESYVTSSSVGSEPKPPDPDLDAVAAANPEDEFYQLQGMPLQPFRQPCKHLCPSCCPSAFQSALPLSSCPSCRRLPGCLKASKQYAAGQDARSMYKAVAGWGTNEGLLTRVLTSKTKTQIQLMNAEYMLRYDRTLVTEVIEETSGDYRDFLVTLVSDQSKADARNFRKSVKGWGTDEDLLVELTFTRTNAQIVAAKTSYFLMYGRDLRDDVDDDTSGKFGKFLKRVLDGKRQEYDPKGDLRHSLDQLSQMNNIDEIRGNGKPELMDKVAEFLAVLDNCGEADPDGKIFWPSEGEEGEPELLTVDELRGKMDGDLTEAIAALGPSKSERRIEKAAEKLLKAVEKGGKDKIFIKGLMSVSAQEMEALSNEYRRQSDGDELFSDATYEAAGLGDFIGSDDFKKCIEAIGMHKFDYWVKRIKVACDGKRGEELAAADGSDDSTCITGYAKPRDEEAEEPQGKLDRFLTWVGSLGTDEDTISRILASVDKCEVLEIARRFKRTYDQPLFEQIDAETSGDYKEALQMWTSGNGFRDTSKLDQASMLTSELDLMDAVLVTSFLTLSLVTADNELVSARADGTVTGDGAHCGP